MLLDDRLKELVTQHNECIDQIRDEWKKADATMLEFQIGGMGRETGGYEKIAMHERGYAKRLITDYHDKIVLSLLLRVGELLQQELLELADMLYEDIEDPRKPWSPQYRNRISKVQRMLSAKLVAQELSEFHTEQQAIQQNGVLDITELPNHHIGDDLLRFLVDQSDEMSPVAEMSKHFLDADVLTVFDASGLIEFGRRRHCFVGPIEEGELVVESGWEFGSITGRNRKPMKEILAEANASTEDERIKLHVHLTSQGRIRVAKLNTELNTTITEPKAITPKADWRDIQCRLLEMYERGDAWPTYSKLVIRLNCSRSTIRKAIKPPLGSLSRLNEDERKEAVSIGKKLSGWKARYARHRKTIPTTSLNEVHLDNIAQTRELDPSEAVTPDDPEDVLALLIQDAKPKVRAKLNAIKAEDVKEMTGDQVRSMVEMIADDPGDSDYI